MGEADLLLYVPLLAALVWAAAEDVLSRRIRNVLTFALAAAGFAQSFLPMHTVTPWDSVEGFAAGFGLAVPPAFQAIHREGSRVNPKSHQ